MGIPRQQDVPFLVCALDHDTNEPLETALHVRYLVQQPEPHVRRHLIVPRSSRMQLTPKRPNQLAQPSFVGGVNVFVVGCRYELE